ncbi:MAG: ABC transporter permease [Planctomycetota bacterium]|jgi:putative ABC transport system permease protein
MRALSPLNKKLVRDLWGVKGQVLAVAAVITAGITAYTALNSAFRDLVLTRDTYMAKYRMADLFFHVERAPASVTQKILALPGVIQAEGRLVFDVTLDIEDHPDPAVGRVISIPDKDVRYVNEVHVASGRLPDLPGANTVVLSEEFAEANALVAGSTFEALVNDKKHPLHVIGTGLSPEYIYVIRGIQDFLPNPKNFGLLWVGRTFAEEAFGYENAVNDIVVRIEEGADGKALLERIGDVLDPYGLIFKYERKDQLSYRSLNDEMKGLEGMAKIMPTIFVTIASVILLILVSRLVRRQREQIGVMKAFGYSDGQVMLHFATFSLTIGVLGTVGGLLAGDLMARAMVEMYTEFFRFPVLRHRIYPGTFVGGLVIGLLGPLIAGIVASRRALRIAPAVALRPEAPAVFTGGTFLETFQFLWKRLPFTWKIIIRNVARHKGRSAFVILGVGLSASILVMVLFFLDSMLYLIHFQYHLTNRQDAKILLSREKNLGALHAARRLPAVKRAEPLLEMPYEVKHNGLKKTILAIGVPPDAQLLHVLDTSERRVTLPRWGIVLPEVTAESLRAREGDVLLMKPLYPGFDEKPVRVSRVVPQYLGQTAYMDIRYASRLVGESMAMNGVLLKTEKELEDDLVAFVKDTPAVATVELKGRTLKYFQKMFIDFMWIGMLFYLLFAGVIGFSVIYTSAALSIGERARDLATLRVLGLRHREVTRVVFGEYFTLSLLGIGAGIPLGLFFAWSVILMYQSELYTFPFVIKAGTFLKAGGAVVLFLLLARLACERPLRKLDMVATLKRSD